MFLYVQFATERYITSNLIGGSFGLVLSSIALSISLYLLWQNKLKPKFFFCEFATHVLFITCASLSFVLVMYFLHVLAEVIKWL